jgi:lactate 2-monooxygenase
MITPSPSYGQQRQIHVYTAGLQGQRPSLPVAPEDLEQAANEHMSREASGYLDGMAESMRANREAFRRWRIVPRMLRDVSQRDLSAWLFDLHLPTPVLLAPIGVQSIVNAEAEVAVARAAASLGVPLVISTASTLPLEQVAQAMDAVPRWFQLYWSRDPEFNTSVVRRSPNHPSKILRQPSSTSWPSSVIHL